MNSTAPSTVEVLKPNLVPRHGLNGGDRRDSGSCGGDGRLARGPRDPPSPCSSPVVPSGTSATGSYLLTEAAFQ